MSTNLLSQTISLSEHVNLLRKTYEAIKRASDYAGGKDGYLKWGNSCDSSDSRRFKMAYVVQAEEEFIKEYKKEILARAAKIINEEIKSVGLSLKEA